MIRAIRRLGWVFESWSLLAINPTFQRFLLAPQITAEPGNQRTVLAEYERERGPILDGPNRWPGQSPPKQTYKFLRNLSRRCSVCAGHWLLPSLYGATGLNGRRTASLRRRPIGCSSTGSNS